MLFQRMEGMFTGEHVGSRSSRQGTQDRKPVYTHMSHDVIS